MKINCDVLKAKKPLEVTIDGVDYTAHYISTDEALDWQEKFDAVPSSDVKAQIRSSLEFMEFIGLPRDVMAKQPPSVLFLITRDFFGALFSTDA